MLSVWGTRPKYSPCHCSLWESVPVRGWEGEQMSFLHQGLPPVKAVVGPMCEGEDGRVHQLPHPCVSLLLTGTEAQIGDLRGEQKNS